jgi:hypothetical protein
MTQESRAEGIDLTAYVNRLFDGFLHQLGFSRYEYLQYVLYRRHEAVTEKGEAFDRTPARRK